MIELRPASRQAAIENVARVLLGQEGFGKSGSEQARLRLALRKLLALLEPKTIKLELRSHAERLAAFGHVDAALLIHCALDVDDKRVSRKLRSELLNKASKARIATRTRVESDGTRYVNLDATSPTPLKLGWLLDVARTQKDVTMPGGYGWRSLQLAGMITNLFPSLVRFRGGPNLELGIGDGDFTKTLGAAIKLAVNKRSALPKSTGDAEEVVRTALPRRRHEGAGDRSPLLPASKERPAEARSAEARSAEATPSEVEVARQRIVTLAGCHERMHGAPIVLG